jgi:transcriptional regulator with XRE-family HTH domain
MRTINPFGDLLKEWRQRRHMSQLDLALAAEVSARHVSFLETGRARPGREMVIQLAEALAIPLRERNGLLTSAGYAANYRQTPLDAEQLRPVRQALELMMERHMPYPALVCDHHWTIVRMNDAARTIFSLAERPGETNIVKIMASNPALAAIVENWPEVAREFHHRLKLEIVMRGGDPVLRDLSALIEADPAFAAAPVSETPPDTPFLPVRFKIGGKRLSFFSTLAQFGTARDITISDLRVELFFPADAATTAAFASDG